MPAAFPAAQAVSPGSTSAGADDGAFAPTNAAIVLTLLPPHATLRRNVRSSKDLKAPTTSR
jgi:hypothetical protein